MAHRGSGIRNKGSGNWGSSTGMDGSAGIRITPGRELPRGIEMVATAESSRFPRLGVSESEDQAGVESGVVSSTGRLRGGVDAAGRKSQGKERKDGEIQAAAQIVSKRST